MDTAECQEVIISTLTRRGTGQENDPVRIITQVFRKDGYLIAESDPCDLGISVGNILLFAQFCIRNEKCPNEINTDLLNAWLKL